MNEIIHIGNADISIKEYKGRRVVTFKDIDMAHGRADGTAKRNFSENRAHFIEGEDYFVVYPKDLETIELYEKRTFENIITSPRGTALFTEQGYLMIVKSLKKEIIEKIEEA